MKTHEPNGQHASSQSPIKSLIFKAFIIFSFHSMTFIRPLTFCNITVNLVFELEIKYVFVAHEDAIINTHVRILETNVPVNVRCLRSVVGEFSLL